MLDPLVVQILVGVVLLFYVIIRGTQESRSKPSTTKEVTNKKGTSVGKPRRVTKVTLYIGGIFFSLLFLNIFVYSILRPYLLPIDLSPLSDVTQIAGFGISLIGMLIILSSYRALGKNWMDASDERNGIYLSSERELVQTGIYSRTRNPIYLGMLFSLAGWALLLLEGVMLVLYPFLLVWTYFEVLDEEDVLHEHFGEQYERYMQRTPRFLPRRKKVETREPLVEKGQVIRS
jgi:protein-S-isoprenylcysteine O-methyltransferase Ste14